tara:strand:- start:24369 stop:25625 length:1257 start_codon:yes stop_codon:yes gene_type:complete
MNNKYTYEHTHWLNNQPVATFVLDEHHKIIFWNQACEMLTGIKSEDVIGTNKHWMGFYEAERPCVADLVLNDNWKTYSSLYSYIQNTSFTKRGLSGGSWVQTKLGRKYVVFEANALLDDEGKLIGAIETLHDASELKQIETELQMAQKLESIGELAAGVAHEINTPAQYIGDNILFIDEGFTCLSKLIGQFNALLTSASNNSVSKDQIKQLYETIESVDLEYLLEEIPLAITQSQEGITSISNIVRSMKEFSHPGSNEKDLTDLNHIIENTVTITKNEWKYVAEIKFDLDKDLPSVPCFAQSIGQVFMNLIVNASHAIADVIDSESSELGTISISTSKVDEKVEIRITDTGKGIPEEIKDMVFDPFFTTKSVGKGTGQGLAIAHSTITNKHNGTIKCVSETGKGTTFIIRLPLEIPVA